MFAAALMLAVAHAADDVSSALSNLLGRTTHDHRAISPHRRFNLETVLPPINVVEQEAASAKANSAAKEENSHYTEAELRGDTYWKESEGEYDPPVHYPHHHSEEMPKGPVDTYHDVPIDRRAHPSEQIHPTYMVKHRDNNEEEEEEEMDGIFKHEEPSNYYFEHPVAP